MFQHDLLVEILGLTVVGAPTALLMVLGIPTLIGHPLSEVVTDRLVKAAIALGLVASLAILLLMLAFGTRYEPINLGDWVHIPHYHFAVKFVFDRLSVPFVILSFVLCGTIGSFAVKYMHREAGFNRFFVLYALFLMGMVITSLAGTIEVLFTGWELVGLSSALLVGFYHERPAPVRNGLQVWVVYRVSDAALLIAAVAMHHLTGEGDFSKLLGPTAWPISEGSATAQYVEPFSDALVVSMTSHQAFVVGLLLLVAAAGKSALVPFSGWLPRAMEGPTPSSAVFYGALSVHLGAFLLLRSSPILDSSPCLAFVVAGVGAVTAVFAGFSGRVQTDIKSALCFASLTQVGIIVAEIGLTSLIILAIKGVGLELPWIGQTLRYLTLIHILGHGCLRTLQFVRAPTLLHDYRVLENALGSRLPHQPSFWKRWVSVGMHPWFYRLALERGYLDACLTDYVVGPFVRLFQGCDALERAWTDFLSGEQSRETAEAEPDSDPLDELR